MTTLFRRQLRMIVADEKGEGVDLGRLSSKFQVSRTAKFALGTAKIAVFNLSADTINKLSGDYTRIRIDAGYTDRIATIFAGDIRNVFVTQDGPDKLTEIFAGDGALDYETARISETFASGTSLREVIRQLAATFKNTGLGPLTRLTDVSISGPYTASGMTRDVLNELSRSYGFRWSFLGGILQVVDKGSKDPQPAIEISRETGMIDSPFASVAGVEVLTLLDPRLSPGRRINVKSPVSRVVSPGDETLFKRGDFKVIGKEFNDFTILRTSHIGETRGQVWYTKAFGLPAGRV